MVLNILIVDDSNFFQRQLKNIIDEHPKLNVIGIASNGREAIDKVKSLKPDIVTMDYEMPMMDGVTAVRQIMAENPVPIMMLSSMTYEGARTTLDALEAGAVDFMTKNFSEISNNSPAIKKRIYDALFAIGEKDIKTDTKENIKGSEAEASTSSISSAFTASPQARISTATESSQALEATPVIPLVKQTAPATKAKILVIAASTGGPAALVELLKCIPASFALPVLIVQHMPENFTRAFAERLNKQCEVTVKEAASGDAIKAGQVLLAPGGKQMIIDKTNKHKVKIIDGNDEVNYAPCADITFASVSNSYGRETLAIVMTGMGQDGCSGAHLLKQEGATIWTQEKNDCLIYGMPMAIDQANLSDASYTVSELQQKLSNL